MHEIEITVNQIEITLQVDFSYKVDTCDYFPDDLGIYSVKFDSTGNEVPDKFWNHHKEQIKKLCYNIAEKEISGNYHIPSISEQVGIPATGPI